MAKKIIKSDSKKSKLVKKTVKIAAVKKASKKKIYQPNLAYISKINRASGQISGIKKMIEGGRHAAEILTQLKAARSAIKALESKILEEYLQDEATNLSSGNAAQKSKKIAEIKGIFVRFE